MAGLHKYGPRFKRRRIHRRHCNALILATRQAVASSGIGPAPSDGNNYRGDQVEDEEAGERDERRQVRGSRKAGRGTVALEDETLEDELAEEEETGELLRPQPAVNLLRQRILGLPLPEPLKMFLLFYRQK